ncbi:salivary protein Tsal1-like [Cochliomyia hominivorax]
MKLIATVLLLAVASSCVLPYASAGVIEAPVDLLENFKISSDDLPEVPLEVEEQETIDADLEAEEDEVLEEDTPEELNNEEDIVEPEERGAGCNINIRSDLPSPQPVYLKTKAASFYPYSDTGYLQVKSGKTLQMFCPSKFKSIAKTLITATCVSGTTFKVGGTRYAFSELVCKSWPSFVAKKTGSPCNGGVLIKVGFKVTSTRFVEQMQVCFNEEEEVTRYVNHTLHPGNIYHETSIDRITFQTAGFFSTKKVDKLYSQDTQLETINKELGGVADKYFDDKNLFLSRGHMAAKADFVYATQQRATFLFINAAPQWQVFNSGNWARVEDGLRAWVSKEKINVQCYTGVYGVTTLPNKEGRQTPLYLSYDANNNGLIPVPQLYFRVVIQPSTKKGIVFIGVNNPHLTLDQIEKDYIICPDVSDEISYIPWKKTDITAGYSYACEVAEFLKVVKNLPDLSAPGGLLV